MEVRPIKSESDYEAALAEIDTLMDSRRGTARGDRLDVLVTLVEAYEEHRWRVEPPDPIDAIKLRMEQRGLTRRDLEKVLGTKSRVSEILNRKRPLTVEMMRRLHDRLAIPAESLIKLTIRPAARRRTRVRAA
jgi:HTH-type transcriptional regulator/antitoxin HigA